MTFGHRPWLLGALAAFLAGIWLGVRIAGPGVVEVRGPAPELRLAPESLVLERIVKKPAGDLPPIPAGASVSAVAWVDIEPMRPLEKIRVNVIELDTPQGPRLQIQTDDGKVIAGQDYRPARGVVSPWGVSLGGMVNQSGIHPASGLSYTRGRWTVGTLAGIKSGPTWPGIVIYANIRF